MVHNCEVYIVVIGKFEPLQQFSNYISNLNIQGNERLLPKFKFIKFSGETSIFTFYSKSMKWCDECHTFWKILRNEVAKTEFSYMFRREAESPHAIDECYRISEEDLNTIQLFNLLKQLELGTKH